MAASPLQLRRHPLFTAVMATMLSLPVATALSLAASIVFIPPRGMERASALQRIEWLFPIVGPTARNLIYDVHLALPIPGHLAKEWRGVDYTRWLRDRDWSEAVYGRMTIGILGGLVWAVPLAWLAWLRAPASRQARWVEGPQIFTANQAIKRARAASKTAIKRTGLGFEIAPGVPIAREREIRSILILGSQRSGKTVVLRSHLRQLLSTPAKLIVHDTKGDMTQTWPDNDFILVAPQDARSWGWDIGRDIRGELATFEFAASLVPEGKDPQWAQGAQIILTALLMALQSKYRTDWGWRELCDVLQLPPAQLRALAEQAYPASAALLTLDDSGTQFTKNAQSYFNSLIAPLVRLVRPLAAAWGDLHADYRVSLTDWLDDRSKLPRVLMLQRMPQFPETSRLWITAAIRHMVGVTGGANYPDSLDRRVWFIMDEFTQLGKIPNLFDVPATHAAKGVCLTVALQSLSQAKELYGPNAPDQLASLTGTKIIMRIEKSETAEYVANSWIGKWRYQTPERVTRPSGTDGKSQTVTEWKDKGPDNLVLSGEFQKLGPHADGVRGLVLNLDENVYQLDWPYEDWPKQRKGAVPASWMTMVPAAKTEDQ